MPILSKTKTKSPILPSTDPSNEPSAPKPSGQGPTWLRKQKRAEDTVHFASWNAQGKLSSRAQMQVFSEDMRSRNISVCAIQETMITLNAEVLLENGDMFVFFGLQSNGYGGLGYYISKKWVGHFNTTKYVTDRIVVARFQRKPTSSAQSSAPGRSPSAQSPGIFSRTRLRSSLTELEKFFRPTVIPSASAPEYIQQSVAPPADSDIKGDIVIINAYGYPADKAKKFPKLVCEFYDTLGATYAKERQGSDLIFLLGDFNAKLGTRGPLDDQIMGKHGKGTRNENGIIFSNFLRENNLFAVNTFFKHRPMQQATWHGGLPAHKSNNPLRANVGGLHNMIDFIVVPRRMICLFTDARAYMPCMFKHRSDHSMVVASVLLGRIYRFQKTHSRCEKPRDHRALCGLDSDTIRDSYQESIAQKLEKLLHKKKGDVARDGALALYSDIQSIIHAAADDTLPLAPRRVNGQVNYLDDPILSKLSSAQQKLSQRIYGKSSNRNARKVRRLRYRRQLLFIQIRDRREELNRAHIDKLASQIESSHEDRATFEFARVLQKNTTQRLKLNDAEGNELRSPALKLSAVTDFYSQFFQRTNSSSLAEWRGEPHELDTPITGAEVSAAAARLSNNRAKGVDGLAAEFLKYGGEVLHEAVAIMLNAVFIKHETIPDLKAGILAALNKPSKKSIVEHTRPIILLTAMRKVLSLIVHKRIIGKVRDFLPLSQHAYLPGRSTAEALWSLQYMRSIAERFGERFHILTIDIQKAFDSLDRHALIAILITNNICNEDELRMIQFLLSDTTLRARVEGQLGPNFLTHIGTPQGDGLSCILFLVYFAHILMRAAPHVAHIVSKDDMAVTYADDHHMVFRESTADIEERLLFDKVAAEHVAAGTIDSPAHLEHCGCVECHARKFAVILSAQLDNYKMKMDPAKTSHREITSTHTNLGRVLGYKFDFEELVKSRKAAADHAFHSMNKLWIKGLPVSDVKKLKIYKATVLPHFTHTGGAVVLRQVDLDRLDSHHRAQLRKLLGVFYPDKISSEALYVRAKSKPISIHLLAARWKLLGHIQRGDPHLPANVVMKRLLTRRDGHGHPVKVATWKGGKKTLLHKILQNDLTSLPDETRAQQFGVWDFRNHHDLAQIHHRAQDRAEWRVAVHMLANAAMVRWQARNKRIVERQRKAQERLAAREAARTPARPRASRNQSTKEGKRRAASEAKTYAAGQTRGGGKGPRKLKPSAYQKPTAQTSSSSSSSSGPSEPSAPTTGIRKFFTRGSDH